MKRQPLATTNSKRIVALLAGCLATLIITDFGVFAGLAHGAKGVPTEVYAPDQVTTDRMAPDPPVIPKIKWWKRPFVKETPPPSEEEIIEIGPRDYPITPGPLLRLSQPLKLASQSAPTPTVIPPGFYLIRYQGTSNQGRVIYLYHGKRLITQIPLLSVSDRAAEPVVPIDDDAPPLESIEARIIDRGVNVLITLTQGKKRYQSAPIPILRDPRPQLSY